MQKTPTATNTEISSYCIDPAALVAGFSYAVKVRFWPKATGHFDELSAI